MGLFKKYVYTIHRNDAAPMLPIIDVAKTYGLPFTCVPVPLRVDKVINGELTTFILPRKLFHRKILDKNYFINTLHLVLEVAGLLIDWSKNIVKTRFNKELPRERLTSWLDKTLSARILIPTLSEDVEDFLKYYFENVLPLYFGGVSVKDSLKQYLEYIIRRCRDRISNNRITVQIEQVCVDYPILEEDVLEEDYLNPDIKGNTIPVDVILKNKIKTMSFRPFLIYQDLLETAKYTMERIDAVDIISPQDLIEKKIISIMEDDKSLPDNIELADLKDKISL